jgi:glycosyltransferase involved in cell wall biosynthesis
MGKRQSVSFNNKLIVFLNFTNDYKGGAQKRYLSLFAHLQEYNYNDYFFLLNESFLNACIKDNIINNTKNIISVKLKYGNWNTKDIDKVINSNPIVSKKQRNSLYKFLGACSSFIRQFSAWFIFSFYLNRIIKEYRIGVIYGIFSGGMWSWLVAKILGIRFIYSYMDASASMIDKSPLKVFSSELYPLKYADKIDFLSEGIRMKLFEKGIKIRNDRVLISPNSFISYLKFYPEYPKIKRIVFSSRLTRFKNPHLLVDSILLLKNEGLSDFEVLILGDGALFNELVQRKCKLQLENVNFLGGVPDTSVYLKNSIIFISIQSDNNYPSQSLMEAMACENAIIASDVGETRKIVSNDVGILIDLNAQSLAKAMKELLSDFNLCERLGKNARKKVMNEHTIENYSRYFLAITTTDLM